MGVLPCAFREQTIQNTSVGVTFLLSAAPYAKQVSLFFTKVQGLNAEAQSVGPGNQPEESTMYDSSLPSHYLQ